MPTFLRLRNLQFFLFFLGILTLCMIHDEWITPIYTPWLCWRLACAKPMPSAFIKVQPHRWLRECLSNPLVSYWLFKISSFELRTPTSILQNWNSILGNYIDKNEAAEQFCSLTFKYVTEWLNSVLDATCKPSPFLGFLVAPLVSALIYENCFRLSLPKSTFCEVGKTILIPTTHQWFFSVGWIIPEHTPVSPGFSEGGNFEPGPEERWVFGWGQERLRFQSIWL